MKTHKKSPLFISIHITFIFLDKPTFPHYDAFHSNIYGHTSNIIPSFYYFVSIFSEIQIRNFEATFEVKFECKEYKNLVGTMKLSNKRPHPHFICTKPI